MTDLLIVTSETDIHADVVINQLQKSNIRAIRLNSESFIQKSKYAYSWQASGNPTQSFLSFEDSLREVQDVGVIWWRKPEDYQVFPEVDDAWAIKYCQEETESLMYSLSGLYPKARWVNK
ncbi:MvdC/MvdD family ATP grasp protein [Microcoleus sp. B7-D4]|uniref:MvdC/MvdD family ATP grasp protein n=1 Tax=Microcoleus sp. B7-D4 TaxID=2818696 RepID=UPI002FD705FD